MNIDPVSRDLLMLDPAGTNGAQLASLSLVNLLNQLRDAASSLWLSGTTAQRPVNPVLGQQYYDTTLGFTVVCTAVRAGAVAATWATL